MYEHSGVSSTGEQDRLDALSAYDISDASTDSCFNNLAELTARIFNVPLAFISLIDGERQWVISAVGSKVKEMVPSETYCTYTVAEKGIFEIPDTRADSRFSGHLSIYKSLDIRYYAGIPLADENDVALGTLCILDVMPRSLSVTEKGILHNVAKDVVIHLLQRRKIAKNKKAEQELLVLSLVASKTNTGVSIQDKEGITTWVNKSLEKMTGYTYKELRGHQMGNILSPNFSDQELILSSRNKSRNNESYTIEVLGEKKDGTPIWFSISNTPILNSKGIVDRQIDLISDITQRKQVEQEMLEAKEQALKLSQAKEMFLSVMSHEIRTPLNAVIGMTHLLLDNDPKVSQIDDLNLLRFSGENLLHIINDILDFTKIETGKMELEISPFSLKTLAHDIISSLQVNVKKNGNRLNLLFDPAIPAQVCGDKNRLYQILMNFLGNAIKFTENGLVELRATLIEENDKETVIKFEVEDNGIGIPKDKQSYIFESFTQARTDIARKYGGTGLGLAITRKLLALFNSDVFVDSVEGEGTTFAFEMKFSKTAEISAVPRLGPEMSAFLGKRVLVVDDNDINILIAKRILSKWGLQIDSALTGYDAIEMITRDRYDLVFMDIRMPGIDGFETTEIIRHIDEAYYKFIPIIALTASTLKNDHYKFVDCGMNGHILKPFNPEEIKQLLAGIFSPEQAYAGAV